MHASSLDQQKGIEKHNDDGKAMPVNRFRLANVMYREAMKEALQKKRGTSFKRMT
jgi:hypothetical protein